MTNYEKLSILVSKHFSNCKVEDMEKIFNFDNADTSFFIIRKNKKVNWSINFKELSDNGFTPIFINSCKEHDELYVKIKKEKQILINKSY